MSQDTQDDDDPAAFTEILTAFGFTDVAVAKVPLPPHLLTAIEADGEDAEEIADAQAAMSYLKATTAQGEFGIFLAAYPVIDLTGSGVSFQELTGQAAPEAGTGPR